MRVGWHLGSGTILLLALSVGAEITFAQAGRPWVDPPANLGAAAPPQPQTHAAPAQPAQPTVPSPPQQAAPPPEPAPVQSAQPTPAPNTPAPARSAQSPKDVAPAEPAPPAVAAKPDASQEARLAARAEAAKNLAVSYLNSWSAPNDVALEASDDFYADRVVFHGRSISVRHLVREKRRFARRWPERDYRPKPDTMKVACEPSGTFCTVHSIFDFMAANPKRRRLAQGVGALQLVVGFVEERPIITAETSLVLGQSRGRRNVALENSSDD
ncbi:MAG TPA: hypothetical protein VEZ16_01040 [Microvirga sp.]|nr:hypothetical protein [Microvirga sp.]